MEPAIFNPKGTEMKTNKCGVILLSAFTVVLTFASASIAQKADVYEPIDNGDVGAGLAADFAVKERATKTKTKITPATIVKAEDQEPKLGYRTFRLCLKLTENGHRSSARAVVSMDQYSNFKLVSWTASKCGS